MYISLTVTIRNTQRKFPIDLARVQEDLDIIRTILNVRDFEVDVWFCSNVKIRQLNDEFRHKSKATDILSFPITEVITHLQTTNLTNKASNFFFFFFRNVVFATRSFSGRSHEYLWQTFRRCGHFPLLHS